ncbi:MAG: hypothetical protein KC505_07250 [Myxococcales bacterium]|nr:hypothetical protein [Myxococcales bacterium]USN51548.1 MAG: hypothetical protein H6731_03835 [Myxococcales bacterium]
MKIAGAKNYWSSIGSVVKDYLSGKKEKLNAKGRISKLKPDRHFISWPSMPKRQIDALIGYDGQPHIELKLIENFIARYDKQKQLENHEVYRSLDEFSMLDMKRKVDIERMVSLLKATLGNMKAIGALNGSHHKG